MISEYMKETLDESSTSFSDSEVITEMEETNFDKMRRNTVKRSRTQKNIEANRRKKPNNSVRLHPRFMQQNKDKKLEKVLEQIEALRRNNSIIFNFDNE